MAPLKLSSRHVHAKSGVFFWLVVVGGRVVACCHVSATPPPLIAGQLGIGFVEESHLRRAASYFGKHPKNGVEGFLKRNHRAIANGSIKYAQM